MDRKDCDQQCQNAPGIEAAGESSAPKIENNNKKKEKKFDVS